MYKRITHICTNVLHVLHVYVCGWHIDKRPCSIHFGPNFRSADISNVHTGMQRLDRRQVWVGIDNSIVVPTRNMPGTALWRANRHGCVWSESKYAEATSYLNSLNGSIRACMHVCVRLALRSAWSRSNISPLGSRSGYLESIMITNFLINRHRLLADRTLSLARFIWQLSAVLPVITSFLSRPWKLGVGNHVNQPTSPNTLEPPNIILIYPEAQQISGWEKFKFEMLTVSPNY